MYTAGIFYKMFKYIIFKIGIPENTYIEPKIIILCEAVPEIRDHKCLFWMPAILNFENNGGSFKISGCFHQNS